MTSLELTLSRILESIQSVPRALRATTRGVVLLQSRSAGNARPNVDGAKQSNFAGGKDLLCPD